MLETQSLLSFVLFLVFVLSDGRHQVTSNLFEGEEEEELHRRKTSTTSSILPMDDDDFFVKCVGTLG